MMHPKDLRIEDFSYELPEEKIAAFPVAERDAARLLVYRDGKISEDIYRNIASHLPHDALLVFNNTRVVQARIMFRKPTGGSIEVFALEPHSSYKDIATAMSAQGSVQWKCLVGKAGKWKHGQTLEKEVITGTSTLRLEAKIIEKGAQDFTIAFSWQPATLSFSEVLQAAGQMPVPPYLKREAQQPDEERYQTIYAREEGSVAAPTAGLHFTDAVFQSLRAKNIEPDFVTLHVGAGTFMPVKSDQMEGHPMHEEFIDISAAFIRKLAMHPAAVFCVGTTSLRTLESLYWMGVKCKLDLSITYTQLGIKQWEVYDKLRAYAIEARVALEALLQWMEANQQERMIIKTQILIAPGYRFHMVRGLITNFHQPRSTLLLLVAALIGERWREVYDYALQNDFRFLSYGDGSLLFLQEGHF